MHTRGKQGDLGSCGKTVKDGGERQQLQPQTHSRTEAVTAQVLFLARLMFYNGPGNFPEEDNGARP